jgi:predicted RNA methylase
MAAVALAGESPASAEQRRKRLGQYFTGRRAAQLLAALAQTQRAGSVIDPMMGRGDMLMGTLEHGRPRLLGGIEIDPAVFAGGAARCQEAGVCTDALVLGSAFSPHTVGRLPTRAWDVVITNPPYVRYQRASGAAQPSVPSAAQLRGGLIATIEQSDALEREDRRLFCELARGYSGLADLAVPSWILCASLVRLGGTLAMLVPATWLSRDYAHPVRYLISRWFDVLCVVEDGDASWFPDALVRATLVVAQRIPRRPSAFQATPAEGYAHVRLTAGMGDGKSLVGATLAGRQDPDRAFADAVREWKAMAQAPSEHPLHPRWVPAAAERQELRRAAGRGAWLRALGESEAPAAEPSAPQPHAALAALCGSSGARCVSLQQLGWRVGQGLRTGANRFFYLDLLQAGEDRDRLRADARLAQAPLDVPPGLTRPVLRRQAELLPGLAVHPHHAGGRVLVLDGWALAEDLEGLPPQPYRPLDGRLAEHVRMAAQVDLGSEDRPRPIPRLSAVAPNARPFDPARPQRPARFWYQLPRLADRHLPSLLVARVNSAHPRTLVNVGRSTVIDANFSTLWPTPQATVDAYGLLAVLNSAWCVAEMELRATVLGGGALKLEAAHLRRLALPRLSNHEWRAAEQLGRRLAQAAPGRECVAVLADVDRLVLRAAGARAPARAAQRVRELAAEWLRRRST